MMSPPQYEPEIRSVLTNLWTTFRGRDGAWTQATFEALRDLGSRYGFESLYSSKVGGPGEWLWDFLWLSRDQSSGHILSMPLVAESEWGKPTLRHDFEKLLVADTHLKLIVLQALTEDQLRNSIGELRSYSVSYRGSSACYLAAGWIYGGQAPHPFFELWSTDARAT
jgi:hypothetical protein